MVTLEIRNKISEKAKIRWANPDFRNKMIVALRQCSRKPRKTGYRLAENKKQKFYQLHKMHKIGMYGKSQSEEAKKKIGSANSIRMRVFYSNLKNLLEHTLSLRKAAKKTSATIKHQWDTMSEEVKRERIYKTVSKACKKPNGSEKKLESLLDKHFPNEWEYVGNGKLIVNGKCPDFSRIDKKQLIELFGTYWHKNDNPEEKIQHYSKSGYECIVVWENELDKPDILIERIRLFTSGSMVEVARWE